MEDQLRTFRRYSRVFPTVPYARHAPRVGCSVVADTKSAVHSTSTKCRSNGSSVKILALLCSKSPQPIRTAPSSSKRARGDPTNEDSQGKVPRNETSRSKAIDSVAAGDGFKASSEFSSASAVEDCKDVQEGKSASPGPAVASASDTVESEQSAKLHVYVRVQYDRALITTLPIEVMRQQHPQVLIDYLLSMSVWT
ncbi:hypothetical protein ABL78_6650 [Leptomonas seymouri]|uniref:Uncharacterized protein n=1 Tax=Leptomonas seymouri TaxID=5684 RepID=A0A0N0P417_LEPSE|nr:hypothetical protein ABL78_6650 [Leptomonas seymouri]|eukprot:KPI84307.1 hypothetical protein ABL78_6650 [Leptomonas seymouri]